MYKLPVLPYKKSELSPFLSEEQMNFHYEKHHKAYIDKLNGFIESDPSLKTKTLEEIVETSSGGLFNNAAQAWNHSFYWYCLAPVQKSAKPSDLFLSAINKTYGGIEELKTKFIDGGIATFGSGWIWLCSDKNGQLSLVSTSNAAVPFIKNDLKPLLVADVWEHAYYIDYKNLRQKYLETMWTHIDWSFVSSNYEAKGIYSFTSKMKN